MPLSVRIVWIRYGTAFQQVLKKLPHLFPRTRVYHVPRAKLVARHALVGQYRQVVMADITFDPLEAGFNAASRSFERDFAGAAAA